MVDVRAPLGAMSRVLPGIGLIVTALTASCRPNRQAEPGAGGSGPAAVESARPSTSAPQRDATRTRSPRRIPKFDAHAHIDPEISKAVEKLMRSYGIVGAANISGGWVGEGLEESLAAAAASQGFLVVFCNLDFSGIGSPGWAAREIARMERAKGLGVKGVKIPKSLGLSVRYSDGRRVPVDDPVLDPVFDAMGRLGLPLLIHTGDPKAFFEPTTSTNERIEELASHPSWSFADRNRFPTWEDLYAEFDRRVRRSKSTTIVGVHFGNDPEDPVRVGRMLDQYPNLYVDTAARVPEIGRRPVETRRVILEHPDRVLFGTDLQVGAGVLVLGAGPARGHTQSDVDLFFLSTWRFFETTDRGFAHPTPIQGAWTIDGIGLPEAVLEKVYHGNAERLFGLAPLKLDADGQ